MHIKQEIEMFNIQDGGGSPIGFTEILRSSERIEQRGSKRSCASVDITKIEVFHKKSESLKIRDGGHF